jgi:hypothetical protein
MKLLRRIVTTIVVTLAVIFVCIYWVAPVAVSFYAARTALPVARIAPTELKDHSVSQSPGTKLSYLGYEFEVPWSDLDEAKTALYPKDKPEKTRVVLTFRSGLRLMVTAVRPREFAELWATDFKIQPRGVEILFGPGSSTSDYVFVRNVYEYTPDKMHYWSLSPGLHAREQMVLMIKSIMPAKAAATGIYYVQNLDYKGFQQGSPEGRQDGLVLDFYSDESHFELVFLQKDYQNATGVTQAEINRVIQSVRKATPTEAATLKN